MNQNQNNGQSQWTQVSGGGSDNSRWEPQKVNPFNANDPNNTIVGYLKDIKQMPGRNGPFNVAEIVTIDPSSHQLSKSFDVSGGKVLDEALNEIALGTYVCIQFTGKVLAKSGGNSYNTWKVFQDTNAIPFQQLGGNVKVQPNIQAPAFNNQQAPPPANNFQQNTQPFPNNNGAGQPNFNTNQSAPAFNQQGTAQPAFNPQFNQTNQAPPQQNTYVPPVPTASPAIPPFNPNGQQQAPGQFGGQNLPNNPFPQDSTQGLPY